MSSEELDEHDNEQTNVGFDSFERESGGSLLIFSNALGTYSYKKIHIISIN